MWTIRIYIWKVYSITIIINENYHKIVMIFKRIGNAIMFEIDSKMKSTISDYVWLEANETCIWKWPYQYVEKICKYVESTTYTNVHVCTVCIDEHWHWFISSTVADNLWLHVWKCYLRLHDVCIRKREHAQTTSWVS